MALDSENHIKDDVIDQVANDLEFVRMVKNMKSWLQGPIQDAKEKGGEIWEWFLIRMFVKRTECALGHSVDGLLKDLKHGYFDQKPGKMVLQIDLGGPILIDAPFVVRLCRTAPLICSELWEFGLGERWANLKQHLFTEKPYREILYPKI